MTFYSGTDHNDFWSIKGFSQGPSVNSLKDRKQAKFKSDWSQIKTMAIINLTPDSFSDGGEVQNSSQLEVKLKKLILMNKNNGDQTVNFLDFGAHSTAPNNKSVDENIEWGRFFEIFIPGLKFMGTFSKAQLPTISIDTVHPNTFIKLFQEINKYLPDLPVVWNDVSGILDNDVIEILNKYPIVSYVMCHSSVKKRSEINGHLDSIFDVPANEIGRFLLDYFKDREIKFSSKGLIDRVYFDPSFGFSKSFEQNIQLINELPWLIKKFSSERKWLIGLSRKSFLRKLCLSDDEKGPLNYNNENLMGNSEFLQVSILTHLLRELSGSNLIFRVHMPELVPLVKKGVGLFT